MTKAGNEKIEIILNKRFSVNFKSGYDPLEVDEFLDEIMAYLKSQSDHIKEEKLRIEELLQQIAQQQQMIDDLRQKNHELEKKNQALINNGYVFDKVLNKIK